MQRRGASGQPVKGQRTSRPKPLKARERRSTDQSPEQFDRLKRERDEALEQLAATSDVLQVISRSPGQLEPVFKAMLENAVRICEAKFGTMFLREGDAFRSVALHNAPPAYAELRQRDPVIHPHQQSALLRLVATRQVVHIADIRLDQGYLAGALVAIAETAGARTLLVVPMLKDNEVVGAILIYRQEVCPFTDKHIELVKNFAAQAVIAIDNTRLLNELRESLQQQTATSEVLSVISSSPGDLAPVFQAMLENATRICGANFGTLFRYDGELLHLVGSTGTPRELVEFQRQRGPFNPENRNDVVGRMFREKIVAQVLDAQLDPVPMPSAKYGGARSVVAVPMLKDNDLVGAYVIYRQEVRPFTDKQIELLKNFAAQAVIAIENTRLLNELRESLQQQTATSEVLKVISSSPGELEPVFKAMLENATRICEAKFGLLLRFDGQAFQFAAEVGTPTALAEFVRNRGSFQPIAGSHLEQVMRTKQVSHTIDYAAEGIRAPPVTLGGARSTVDVPLLKDDELVGVFSIYRQEVRPFTDKQIELVKNFAAQAVIAIENARLLSELRESLQQQTATADVLKVISRSTFDLHTVLQTLVESAVRLCDADKANITREKNGVLYRAESYGFSREFMDHVNNIPIKAERGSIMGRALLERRVIHIPDVKADPEFTWLEAQRLGDFRTVLTVPMLREGVPIGVLTLARTQVRPFTDKQIELFATFADQAVIAIENVRLFEAEQRARAIFPKRLNIRRRPARCSTSSVVRRRTPSRFSMQSAKVPRVCAKQCSALPGGTMASFFTMRQATISRLKCSIAFPRHIPSDPTGRSLPGGRY